MPDTGFDNLFVVALVALLAVRGAPALLHRRQVPTPQVLAAGLLEATSSMPFLVTASMIGTDLGVLSPVTGAALVGAGVASVPVFPTVALGLLREPVPRPAPPPRPFDRRVLT